ncbi:hypothetical protein FKM82_007970 [Ascaphus truei]
MFPLLVLCLVLWRYNAASESLGKPELKAESTLTAVGRTETLRCLCSSGSLPITYSLFKDREMKGIITVSEPREAVFNVTITDSGSLGVFKCKANHSLSSKAAYSKDFNFTLQEPLTKTSLKSSTSETAIGRHESLVCHSNKGRGSPPISYALFHNGDFIANVTGVKHGHAEFNISIVNASSLGPYTCRASDGINTSPSTEFRFTLRGGLTTFHVVIICALLFLLFVSLTLLIVVILIRRRRKGGDVLMPAETIYTELPEGETVAAEERELEYCTVLLAEGRGGKALKW